MERRDFLAGAALTGAGLSALDVNAEENAVEREYYEYRTYNLLPGDRNGAIHDYLEKAAIPAWNRLGVGPVGVFTGVYGGEWTTLEVLLPHPSLASIASTAAAMADDEVHQRDGAAFLQAPADAPEFVRYESSIMVAFSGMPKLKQPEKKGRIFEIRTYESHSEKFAKKKIEMFNEGGEIAIFLETGLIPVFFGETLVGPRMPNLTYMLVFDDMADHDASWANFVKSDKWKALSGDSQYKDTVSNIHNRILRPTGYSQI
tara:strand:- start:53 stop:829 length:777 start_codon:yes stop_codon:yes gene_type:complete